MVENSGRSFLVLRFNIIDIGEWLEYLQTSYLYGIIGLEEFIWFWLSSGVLWK